MPTEYTGMLSIDRTRVLQDDGEHCPDCGELWPRETLHARPVKGKELAKANVQAKLNEQRFLLKLYDKTEAYPTIRAAIREILQERSQ
jgi:hypothetical protein